MKNTFTTSSGTTYRAETPEQVVNAIERAWYREDRVRVWYGKDGVSWNEENDVTGYIGRTTGNHTPILIHNKKSIGGGAILTDCIIKMVNTRTGELLYKHPNFTQPVFIAVGLEVLANNETYARFRNESSAKRYADFMNGKRNNK
jgi:hypothetical protein